jgi:DNA integrity scanning protein DisA with diadenylate cyclase activity
MVIDGGRIVAAKCILPVTQSDVPKDFGTRHRAAIGLSELTDAVVIVVSEETGGISIVKNGQIKHNIDPLKFGGALKRALGQKNQ